MVPHDVVQPEAVDVGGVTELEVRLMLSLSWASHCLPGEILLIFLEQCNFLISQSRLGFSFYEMPDGPLDCIG